MASDLQIAFMCCKATLLVISHGRYNIYKYLSSKEDFNIHYNIFSCHFSCGAATHILPTVPVIITDYCS